MKVWLDGALVDEADARVSVFDHGLTVGDGVFETLKTYGGRAFALRRHLDRLAASAAGMGLAVPPANTLRAAVEAVVAASGLEAVAVRITVTGGLGPLGSGRGGGGPTVVVAARPLPLALPAVDVVVVPWPRNERGALAGLKTTSYGENVVALAYARERGGDEAIFANLAGRLCEGTGSNVVVEHAGRLVTPPLAAGCLAGVTRALLLEAGAVVEEDVSLDALASSSEAFLTSTTREVQPIGAVDGHPLPAGTPGPLTAGAGTLFAALVAKDLDP
ncbi:MAG TPA: aminotransferase class IV [Acidimicrobiales bacterium]|nr:aminotransferase class IV [Acidimicrobiales bacterium]